MSNSQKDGGGSIKFFFQVLYSPVQSYERKGKEASVTHFLERSSSITQLVCPSVRPSVRPSVANSQGFPSYLIYYEVGQILGSSYAEHNICMVIRYDVGGQILGSSPSPPLSLKSSVNCHSTIDNKIFAPMDDDHPCFSIYVIP